jgi:hypothetical protein
VPAPFSTHFFTGFLRVFHGFSTGFPRVFHHHRNKKAASVVLAAFSLGAPLNAARGIRANGSRTAGKRSVVGQHFCDNPPMNSPTSPADDEIVSTTRDWLVGAVIGLNLCPFAKAVHVKQQIRYVVSRAETGDDLLRDLINELEHLATIDAKITDTTLLIHPFVLGDFLDFNDFLDEADALLQALDLEGEIQVASFHPDYQFADAHADAAENGTNRSPYPTLHLLRESSIDQAVASGVDTDAIYLRNIETLRRLGNEGWHALWRSDDPT